MKKQKADIDLELDNYEPSSASDDDYDDNEKVMLQQAAKRRSKNVTEDDDESEEEVFGIHESDEDEDDDDDREPLGEEMDSDIEGKDQDEGGRLPDAKAWGSRKNVYYKTDYVDQDYGGFSKAEEEEAALKEEEEARSIQTRLIAELDDPDIYSLGIDTSLKDSGKKLKDTIQEDDEFGEVIKTDLSKLSKREKLLLLEKESPEFQGLITDFKERLAYAKNNLEPILKLVQSGEIPKCPAATFVTTKFHTTLNYCTNIVFYLLLKSRRVRVTTHPVIKRLVQYRKLLEEMDPTDTEIIQPQIKEILKLKEKGKPLRLLQPDTPSLSDISGNRADRRRKLQQLREEQDGTRAKHPKTESFEEMQVQRDVGDSDGEDANMQDETEKRGITFEIAKNKGLTPRRKKENRNPRVKNRNKFRKATIRRKGQVRTPYKEKIPDGTVPFGIKAGVVKSIKLK